MGRPKGSKNETDNLEAFARRIERQIVKASLKDMETMERLVCRLLTNDRHPQIAAMLAAKWVEWRYGKPTERVEHSGPDGAPILHTIRFGNGNEVDGDSG